MIHKLGKRLTQPQDTPSMDWGNPLNAGMFSLISPVHGYDFVNRLPISKVGFTSLTTPLQSGPLGTALKTNGTNRYVFTAFTSQIVLTDWTLFTLFDTTQTALTMWMTCLGSSTNGNPLLGIISGNSTASKLRLFERTDSNVPTEADTTITVNDGVPHIVHLSCYTNASANRVVDCYVDGKFDTAVSFGASIGLTFTIDRFTVGALLRSSASNFWAGRTYLAGASKRAWSADDIRRHTVRPWQLFTPRRRLLPVGILGAATNTLKTINALAATNAKTIQGIARASVKTYDGLTPP
jgi:hypothetical protein